MPRRPTFTTGFVISVSEKKLSTLPVTSTSSPTVTVGVLLVNTYTPLEVSLSSSARASGVCMVKPWGPTPVTMLACVATALPW